jgi:hypothetical protein
VINLPRIRRDLHRDNLQHVEFIQNCERQISELHQEIASVRVQVSGDMAAIRELLYGTLDQLSNLESGIQSLQSFPDNLMAVRQAHHDLRASLVELARKVDDGFVARGHRAG